MTTLCDKCQLIHPPLVECSTAQRRAIQSILMKCGKLDRCPAPCGKTIYWMVQLNGKRIPITEAGLLHFIDCTGRYKELR